MRLIMGICFIIYKNASKEIRKVVSLEFSISLENFIHSTFV